MFFFLWIEIYETFSCTSVITVNSFYWGWSEKQNITVLRTLSNIQREFTIPSALFCIHSLYKRFYRLTESDWIQVFSFYWWFFLVRNFKISPFTNVIEYIAEVCDTVRVFYILYTLPIWIWLNIFLYFCSKVTRKFCHHHPWNLFVQVKKPVISFLSKS